MFWNLLYVNWVYWENHVFNALWFDFDDLYYNLFWSYSWIKITNMPDIWSLDQLDYRKFDIAVQPGMWESEYNIKSKKITVNCSIHADSESDLQDKITIMKADLAMYDEAKKSLYLKLKNWVVVQAPAKPIRCYIPREQWTIGVVLKVVVVFEIINPFLLTVDRTWYSYPNITTLVNDDILLTESEDLSNPKIIIVFNSATAVTELVVSIWNKSITINEAISPLDIIVIDPTEYQVSINDISDGIDRDWIFPVLFPGTNLFTVQPNGTYDFSAFISFSNSYV